MLCTRAVRPGSPTNRAGLLLLFGPTWMQTVFYLHGSCCHLPHIALHQSRQKTLTNRAGLRLLFDARRLQTVCLSGRHSDTLRACECRTSLMAAVQSKEEGGCLVVPALAVSGKTGAAFAGFLFALHQRCQGPPTHRASSRLAAALRCLVDANCLSAVPALAGAACLC